LRTWREYGCIRESSEDDEEEREEQSPVGLWLP